jgi:hypothetical protein
MSYSAVISLLERNIMSARSTKPYASFSICYQTDTNVHIYQFAHFLGFSVSLPTCWESKLFSEHLFLFLLKRRMLFTKCTLSYLAYNAWPISVSYYLQNQHNDWLVPIDMSSLNYSNSSKSLPLKRQWRNEFLHEKDQEREPVCHALFILIGTRSHFNQKKMYSGNQNIKNNVLIILS